MFLASALLIAGAFAPTPAPSGPPTPPPAAGCATDAGVVVVVDAGRGRPRTACAPGDPDSALGALQEAGFSPQTTARGTVCRVEGLPTSCVDDPPAAQRWTTWRASGGIEWRPVEPDGDPAPGDVVAWRLGAGQPAFPPPAASRTAPPAPETITPSPSSPPAAAPAPSEDEERVEWAPLVGGGVAIALVVALGVIVALLFRRR